MKKFSSIKDRYQLLGVKEDNIDFAIDAILDGTKREIIIDALTSIYRGMKFERATQLLNDLYEANGGEYKSVNREGFLYGILFSLAGLLGVGFLVGMITSGEWKFKFLLFFVGLAFTGFVIGPRLIIKSIKGQYRENDSPFDNE